MPTNTEIKQLAQPQNPLDKEQKEHEGKLNQIYSEEDREYLSFVQARLERARRLRDIEHPEFNGKTYLEYFEENEKIANTHHLDPRKNKDDVIVSAGTVEQKLDALLSNINNLNLGTEVLAYDRNNNRIVELGHAMDDIVKMTEMLDGADGAGDEEKRPLRQRELLKQGTVFVQEEWLKKFETKKKLKEKFNGQFTDYKGWSEKMELVFEGPTRTQLYGPNVYLGDITEFYIENQPFISVVVQKNYEEARKTYGKFDNWKFVQKGKIPPSSINAEEAKTIFENKWRMTELKDEQVEIVFYQDQANDEFQIIINGVLMMPIGFPLSAVTPAGKYNVTKQVFRPINDKFAYGAAFVSSGSVKEVSAIIDEMLKLFILKTRKSFTPAYVNISGRVIDSKVLSPGRISMGIDPNALQPIAGNEVQGVTNGELGMYKELQSLVNKSTVSDQFTGQAGQGRQTATEVIELQRQARLTLGLAILSCTLLEKKLGYLRLWNILQNWFEPIGDKVQAIDGARQLVKEYRRSVRDVSIEGEGLGERMVIPMDGELPDPQVIREMERKEGEKRGMPVKKLFLNPEKLKAARLTWYIVVNPEERESSPFFKLLFREQLNDMLTLMQLGSRPDVGRLEEEYARVWKLPRTKLFQRAQLSPNIAGVSSPGEGGVRTPDQNEQAKGRTATGLDAAMGGLEASGMLT